MPEIEQGLSEAANSKVTVSFTPHLMPMVTGVPFCYLFKLFILTLASIILKSRGMQSTIYVKMASGASTEELYQYLKHFYEVNYGSEQPLILFTTKFGIKFLLFNSIKCSLEHNIECSFLSLHLLDCYFHSG